MVTIAELIIFASSSVFSFLVGMLVNAGRAAKARRKMIKAEQDMLEAHAELLEVQKSYALLANRVPAQGIAPAVPVLSPADSENSTGETPVAPILPIRAKGNNIQASAQ